MLKLQAQNTKIAIFFNHRELINEAYNNASTENVGNYERYKLKADLFQFQQKAKQQQEQQKKRKRKAIDEQSINGTWPCHDELEVLKKYLNMLPKPEEQVPITESHLNRCWEAKYNVPQLHGANLSGKFQDFKYSDATYLIPHGAQFYNHNVDQLPKLLPQLQPSYDIIIMDPPWRNKYIRRLKRAKESLGYSMLDNDEVALMPVDRLIHKRSLVAIWCTNSSQHQIDVETKLLPRWHLRLVHKLKWYKLNTKLELIAELTGVTSQKQPFELLYIACHTESPANYAVQLKDVELLLSVPSIIHSHKPPLLSWLKQHLEEEKHNINCLELFARYLQPQFTSIGLEVLKLMDSRLYNKIDMPK